MPGPNKVRAKAKAKAKEFITKDEAKDTVINDDNDDQLVVIDNELTSQDFAYRTTNTVYILLVRITKEDGTFHPKFSMALRMLADSIYLYAELNRQVKRDGSTYEAKSDVGSDVIKVNPAFTARNIAQKEMIIGLKSFGLDPASASGISKNESDSKTQLAEIMANMLGNGKLEDDFT
ncbi:MAG TPA: P27 family phage terminase small subunit [Methylococcaceae bacterium]|nr:P27 family phage terminase small subunit [Methylococcaceae bacterium]